MADVVMPQLGETVTEGTITRWMKAVGEYVEQDEPLFEISTDKVDSEVPSPYGGILSEILVQEGKTVPVGTVLAVLAVSGEVSAASPSSMPPTPPISASPPQGASPTLTPPPLPKPPQSSTQPVSQKGSQGNSLLSPLVRKLLKEHDINPSVLKGTGLGGRITRDDVLAYIDKQALHVKDATQPPTTKLLSGRDEIVPFTNIRRRTAEHMLRSKATSAHTLVSIEVDFENVELVRRMAKDSFLAQEGFHLTYLPFIARAVSEVIKDWPYLNSSVDQDTMIVHHYLNLAIAVDLPGTGLIAPVIHNADTMSLIGLARAIFNLATKARSRDLNADDIAGGTFTISNPGPFGTFMTIPIINQPQVAILSTDGIKRRPVVLQLPDGGESIAIHSTGILALSFDHRAVDGAYAAGFLAKMAKILQESDWAVEL